MLREAYPDARIVVVSDTPELDHGKLGADQYLGLHTPFARVPLSIRRGLWRAYYQYVDVVGKLRPTWVAKSGIWFRGNRSVYRMISRSDLVVSCGGGYVSSLGKVEVRLALMRFRAGGLQYRILAPVGLGLVE